MQIVRWYKFSQLTTSILNHLMPYKEQYIALNDEIIATSTQVGQADKLAELQIKASSIQAHVDLVKEIEKSMKSLIDLDLLRRDKEMADVVEEEIEENESELQESEEKAIDMILEKDNDDSSDVILEIKPGVGGSESSLFSEDMFNMYMAFAYSMKWR